MKPYTIFFNYLTKFISSILFFLATTITIILFTIFNQNFIAQQLNETNYYEKLYTNIKLEMSYYVTQSGLSDDILNNIFDKELLRRTTEKMLDNFWVCLSGSCYYRILCYRNSRIHSQQGTWSWSNYDQQHLLYFG